MQTPMTAKPCSHNRKAQPAKLGPQDPHGQFAVVVVREQRTGKLCPGCHELLPLSGVCDECAR